MPLAQSFLNDSSIVEIGVDEAGRGPMFGSVFAAAVILPRDDTFKHELMKDSKKFTSKQNIKGVAEYIKENAIAYAIASEDENSIDKNNIRMATHKAMHRAIKDIIKENNNNLLLVDGRDFTPLTYYSNINAVIKEYPVKCIEGGDNKYTSIAAASILAKVARDEYIDNMCKNYPKLDELYDLSKNKGYGTANHIKGINENGISKWHRKSFGICQKANIIDF